MCIGLCVFFSCDKIKICRDWKAHLNQKLPLPFINNPKKGYPIAENGGTSYFVNRARNSYSWLKFDLVCSRIPPLKF